MMTSQFAYASQSPMGQMMLEGVFEILGQAATNAVINLARLPQIGGDMPPDGDVKAGCFRDITAVQLALEALYGRRGGQGVALRSGRASASLLLRRYSEKMGFRELSFRLQPVAVRIRQGLEIFAHTMSDLCSLTISITENDHAWQWEIQECPVCWQRQSEAAICHFFVGLLQEFLNSISGGKLYSVVESECVAAGKDACVFTIDKAALE